MLHTNFFGKINKNGSILKWASWKTND